MLSVLHEISILSMVGRVLALGDWFSTSSLSLINSVDITHPALQGSCIN